MGGVLTRLLHLTRGVPPRARDLAAEERSARAAGAVEWAQHECSFWRNSRGQHLFEQRWLPKDRGRRRIAVVIVHGLHGHSSRYAHIAQILAPRGYSVFCFDFEGHGRSEGLRGDFKRFSWLVDDATAFIARVRRSIPQDYRLWLLGHSLGGCVAASVVERPEGSAHVDALLLSAPLLSLRMSSPLAALAAVVSQVYPVLVVSKLQRNLEGEVDPLMYEGGVNVRQAHELYWACRRVRSQAKSIRTPAYIAHSIHDTVTDPTASQRFFERITNAELRRLKLYSDIDVHELLQPKHCKIVIAHMFSWAQSLSSTARRSTGGA